jgi:CHAT domain-containing protein
MLSGCHAHPRLAPKADPEVVYQTIRSEMLAGNLDLARKEAQQAGRDFAARGDWPTRFRLLQAKVLTYQGLSSEVVPLLDCDGTFPPTAGDLAIQQKLLCSLAHVRLNQSQKSAQELHDADQLSDTSNSSLRGEVLQTKGLIERHFDQLASAKDAFEQSLGVARQNRDAFLEASDLLNLGMVALQSEHYDEAVELLHGAADFARPVKALQVMEAASGNLGVAYFHLGDFEKSLSNFQQAGQEAKEIGTTSAQVDWLWDAGSSYYKLGNLPEAKSCYEQALKSAIAIDDREEIAGISTVLASLLYQQGQFDAAGILSDEAVRAVRSSGDKSAELEPRFLQTLLATRQRNGPNPEQLMMQVYRDSAESPSLRWDIENALANLYETRHQSQQAERWYRTSIQTFENQRAAVKDEELKLPFFANGDALYRDYAGFLIASHRSNEALQLLDLGRSRTLEDGLGLAKNRSQALDAQKAAARLNAVILFYSLGPEGSYLWVVNAHRTGIFVLPAQSDIESLVAGYQRAILKSSDPLQQENRDAASLYNTLIAPAASMIPKGSRVLLIPDAALNGLNFETLLAPGQEGPHYWIEDVTVTNANSIRLLSRVENSSKTANAKNLLLLGNPISPSPEYENLPNAPAEIAGIQKHFAPADRTVLTQTQAVPAAYKASRPDRFAYVHFVAHGTASRLSPLDSAVVLSATPGHPDNFKLYARDIVHNPLHARLVTISACYGSGLRAYAGEGLVGLSWAFLRAGSHNVIGALWEVNDASTPMLMDRLYTELEAGSSPDVALRAAKLALIHSAGVYRKPLYWAAFQLYAGS